MFSIVDGLSFVASLGQASRCARAGSSSHLEGGIECFVKEQLQAFQEHCKLRAEQGFDGMTWWSGRFQVQERVPGNIRCVVSEAVTLCFRRRLSALGFQEFEVISYPDDRWMIDVAWSLPQPPDEESGLEWASPSSLWGAVFGDGMQAHSPRGWPSDLRPLPPTTMLTLPPTVEAALSPTVAALGGAVELAAAESCVSPGHRGGAWGRCPVCLETRPSRVLVPCGHTACHDCVRQVLCGGSKCPICREQVASSTWGLFTDPGSPQMVVGATDAKCNRFSSI
mmetsp:Transcript_2826/g.11141  ORF Transcript_2826/g.11141 Transcript_2826/m.11141 type:complete len:281 (+) Transcript_2826:66-908(+)